MRVHHAGRPLSRKHSSAVLGDECDEPPLRDLRTLPTRRQLLHSSIPMRNTSLRNRARATFRFSRRAYQSPQLHQRLIELRDIILSPPLSFFPADVTM